MKIKLPVIPLMLAALITITACGGSDDDKNTLTIMGKKTDLNKSYMTTLFERYESTTGNKLKIIAYDDTDFEISAQKDFESGNAPDIFMHFNNADLNRFDVENNFYLLNDEPWVDELTDSADAYCRNSDGDLLGLPFWENSVSGCYYNKTIMDSLGLKPATTQAEFDGLCQVLKDTGYTPICWPANGCSWMMQFGLDPVFADNPKLLEKLNKNEITYAEIPEVRAMVQWVSDAAEKGWFGPNYIGIGWNEISPEMSSGNAVMTFIWDTWFYTDMESSNTYTVDDFAVMPVFMNTADKGTYEGGNLNMMMLNKNSKKLEEAKQFLAFCASEENYNAAFDGISTVKCFDGQTTNIQSKMVTDAKASIEENERVSTASSRIVGYSGDDVTAAFDEMFRKKTDVDGCIKMMDQYRIEEAKKQGAEGF